MAKFGASSSVGMLATVGDGEGVDVGTRDGPRGSIGDGDGVKRLCKELIPTRGKHC